MIRRAGCYPVMKEMPLWAAATLAYKQILSTRPGGRREPSSDELDLVALVLSGYVPIYAGEPRAPLEQKDLEQGMFWGGARRFESRRGASHAGLSVRSRELERTPERIRGDLWDESSPG